MGENDGRKNENREPNRLIDCSSPYLQQHAYNPVDWYPWGEEALDRARGEDRPILLSIGYAACHWCHVMERECFEDPEIARLMNENFVCIKVDREERPDLDELYMRAVQALTGSGGWPLNVFLTPDLVPFYGGTYWPPEDRGQMPGFPRVLRQVAEAYRERREEVESSGRQVIEALEMSLKPPEAEGELSEQVFESAVRQLAEEFDLRHAGFGGGPKFPQTPVLECLLRMWAADGSEQCRMMARTTLQEMARGGIYDQLGGGFHRYATDRRWLVPHFEKMLYDNAQLMGLYADAYRAWADEEFLETALGTAEFLMAEMRDPSGGFFSAVDADSEGVEGKYYAWTREEIVDCLGPEDGPAVATYFGATETGNWERGRNVLHRPKSLQEAAEHLGLDEPELAEIVERGRAALLQRRRERKRPATDTKVMTDSNALAVSGLLRVYRAGGDERHRRAARECADFVCRELWPGDELLHTWKDGAARVSGFLTDYAFLAAALLDLYETSFDLDYLRAARSLADEALERFWHAKQGAFEEASGQRGELIAPVRGVSDQPLPSGAAVACDVLLRLAHLTGERDYEEPARRVLRRYAETMAERPQVVAARLSAALRHLSPPREFVIVGIELEGAHRLISTADEFYLPLMVRAGAESAAAESLSSELPLLEGRSAEDGRPVAFVCSGGACRQPTSDPDELREQFCALASRD